MNGFIKLHRRIRDHWLWEHPDELRAFIDLLLDAEWKPKKRVIKGCIITLERGQTVASLRFLGARWGWSKNKVGRFLDMLETDQMVGQQKGQGITVITICNYESYQGGGFGDGTADGTDDGTQKGQRRDTGGTEAGQRRDEHEDSFKNGKEGFSTSTTTHASRIEEHVEILLRAACINRTIATLDRDQLEEFRTRPLMHDRATVDQIAKLLPAHIANRSTARKYSVQFLLDDLSNLADGSTFTKPQTRNGHSNQPQRGSLRTGDQSDASRFEGDAGLGDLYSDEPLR